MVEHYTTKGFVNEKISADCQLKTDKNIAFIATNISEGWVVNASDQQQNVRNESHVSLC